MQTYKFSKKAEGDLMGIWIYTFDVWGKIQADNYVQAIYSVICLLVENPQMGKSREALRTGYRSYYQIHPTTHPPYELFGYQHFSEMISTRLHDF